MGMGDDVENEVQEYSTLCEQQYFITDLVSQLTMILNDKARLENENITLKRECKELSEKLSEYEHNMEKEKSVFMEEFKNPKAKNNIQCQEQNKYLTEVHSLKRSYYKHKDLCAKKEEELVNKINFLNAKIEENERNYTAMKSLADKNKKKYASYKAKVKFARGVIKKLTHKPLAANKGCQTETKDKKLCSVQEDNFDRRTENGILAKLFFKQLPYSKDNESFTLD